MGHRYPTGDPVLREVDDGIYAHVQPDGSWYINTTGFLVGRRGVASVDTCATERRTRGYLAAIASVTDLPVRTVVNTHHHGDHTYGNYLFAGATVVAHEQCRTAMLAEGLATFRPFFTEVDWGELELAPPFLTFTDAVTLYVDDLRCEVRHVGRPAHTTNDSIVWIPDRSVLFSGDLIFNGGTPFLLMGSVAGALDVLETQVAPLRPRTIVPGHGDVCGPEAIDRVTGYLRFVLDTARQARAAGLAPLEAAREADLGEYADLLDSERLVGNLHRAYADLDGTDVVPAAAVRDMITYNGGRPLTSHA